MTELPGFPTPAVSGHAGTIVVGRLGGHDVLVLAGRVHLYEGHTAHEVCHGVRVAAAAGVHTAVLTNAAGGIRPDLAVGSLVRIADHVNLSGANPLTGPHDGPQPSFVDLSAAYDPELRRRAARWPGHDRGGLRRPGRAQLRDPGRDPHAGHDRRRPGGHVDRQRDDRLRHLGVRVAGVSLVTNRAAGPGRAAVARRGDGRGPGGGGRHRDLPACVRPPGLPRRSRHDRPITPAELAACIDHTLLRPEATDDEVTALCAEAAELGVAAACVVAHDGPGGGRLPGRPASRCAR